jgi:hypothetical protein
MQANFFAKFRQSDYAKFRQTVALGHDDDEEDSGRGGRCAQKARSEEDGKLIPPGIS